MIAAPRATSGSTLTPLRDQSHGRLRVLGSSRAGGQGRFNFVTCAWQLVGQAQLLPPLTHCHPHLSTITPRSFKSHRPSTMLAPHATDSSRMLEPASVPVLHAAALSEQHVTRQSPVTLPAAGKASCRVGLNPKPGTTHRRQRPPGSPPLRASR
jgi:hypothetical protein